MNPIAQVTHVAHATPVDYRHTVAAARGRAFCPAPVGADALVERMILGDGVAVDELKLRFGKRLIAIATDVLGDDVEAERIVDCVFDEASFGWPPERGQVERWLARLVRRAARVRAVQFGFDA